MSCDRPKPNRPQARRVQIVRVTEPKPRPHATRSNHARGDRTWAKIQQAEAEIMAEGIYPSSRAIGDKIGLTDEAVRHHRDRREEGWRAKLVGRGLKPAIIAAKRDKGEGDEEEEMPRWELAERIRAAGQAKWEEEQLARVFRHGKRSTIEIRETRSYARGRVLTGE